MITVKPSAAADVGAIALEYSGLSAAADATAVDQTAHASGTTGAAATVGSPATPPTNAPNELALGLYADSGFGNSLAGAPAYTTRANVSPAGDIELLAEDQVVASGATPSATVATGASTTWSVATLVFRAAPTGPSTPPSAPIGVTAAAGDASASVTWSAPANGGSPITSYTITPYIGSTRSPRPRPMLSELGRPRPLRTRRLRPPFPAASGDR
jgi:hypothetical protein